MYTWNDTRRQMEGSHWETILLHSGTFRKVLTQEVCNPVSNKHCLVVNLYWRGIHSQQITICLLFYPWSSFGDWQSYLICLKSVFGPKFQEFPWCEVKKLNPCEMRLNIRKLRKLRELEFELLWVFPVFWWLIQSEVKKIIWVKSTLHGGRFNPREMRFMSHLNDSSFLDISIIL